MRVTYLGLIDMANIKSKKPSMGSGRLYLLFYSTQDITVLSCLYFQCEDGYGLTRYGVPTASLANSTGESSYNDLRVDALMNPLNLPRL